MAVGYPEDAAAPIALDPTAAAAALLQDRLDLVGMVEAWESQAVQTLLAAEQVQIADMPRVDAHVALNPFLTKLVLPQGVADLIRNRPPKDVVLMAPKVSLVVRRLATSSAWSASRQWKRPSPWSAW